ncbi:Bpu10I family restriction endonuclease [Laspinema olomoucense]|uniref:Bpu10I family restriction endonuclease n=1 Tax=Laspinema olomoucense TaxID=3231600 RepID=UPI0021BB17C3|nr:Bpu10I family restriction endonuclease [Laspinema sp. D3d]MCT7973845.1 Bpu10I family restriction endonuclease [Laspinema sp. D3d]
MSLKCSPHRKPLSLFNNQLTKYNLLESHGGYVCAECKTNLDKTMFQEAVATNRDFTIAVPSSMRHLD